MNIKYILILLIGAFLFSSCNKIPDEIKSRKDAINHKLDSLGGLTTSKINLKTCSMLLTSYKLLNDSIVVLIDDCSKRKVKIDLDNEIKILSDKQSTLNKLKIDLLENAPIGTWSVTLTTGEDWIIEVNKDHTWFSPRINSFAGSMEGVWEGTSTSLYFSTYSNTVNFGASVSEDGEYLYVNLNGTSLTLKKR
ncbi:MAG: hypothetical protein ACK44N_02975 [Bacteroidota bacterium]|jgi:hypothetical protein